MWARRTWSTYAIAQVKWTSPYEKDDGLAKKKAYKHKCGEGTHKVLVDVWRRVERLCAESVPLWQLRRRDLVPPLWIVGRVERTRGHVLDVADEARSDAADGVEESLRRKRESATLAGRQVEDEKGQTGWGKSLCVGGIESRVMNLVRLNISVANGTRSKNDWTMCSSLPGLGSLDGHL